MCYYRVKKTSDGPRKETNLRKLADELGVKRKIIGDGADRCYVLRATSEKKLNEYLSYYLSHTTDSGVGNIRFSGGKNVESNL